MKNIIFTLICSFMLWGSTAQNLIGAWEGSFRSEDGKTIISVAIFTENYQVVTQYDALTGKFIGTRGGSCKISGDTLTEKLEFDSLHPENVGTERSFNISLDGSTFQLSGTDLRFKRMDDGTPGKLQGAWLMSGRVIDGKTTERDTTSPRKTMKILSGTRFQWIAYDTSTKQFMATGGGSYTTEDGNYKESIEFFSRDDSRVGMELVFQYHLMDGAWHHSGRSSKGDPINEIWRKRL